MGNSNYNERNEAGEASEGKRGKLGLVGKLVLGAAGLAVLASGCSLTLKGPGKCVPFHVGVLEKVDKNSIELINFCLLGQELKKKPEKNYEGEYEQSSEDVSYTKE